MATFYATFEHADVHPDGTRNEYFGYFDSLTHTSYETISSAKTIAAFVKGAKQIELAVWQVNLSDVVSMNPNVLDDGDGVGWWQIEVEDNDTIERQGIPATFVSLAAIPGEEDFHKLQITSITPAPGVTSAALDKFFSPPSLKTTNPDALAVILNGVIARHEEIHVAVYDMGQANCNAIVDQNEHPLAFFDLGWPIQTNSAGVPKNKPDLFICDDKLPYPAPVILSHWDWDHWAYALDSWRFNGNTKAASPTWNLSALQRQWIVPRPIKAHRLGPSHWALFTELYKTRLGKSRVLNLWPKQTEEIEFFRGAVVKCSPAKGRRIDRNNSGLALYINDKFPHDEVILLPADADYSSIPPPPHLKAAKAITLNLVGLVASHHGGKVNVYTIPETANPKAKLAVSNGFGNTYRHPNKQAMSNYDFKGWKHVVTTYVLQPCSASVHVPTHLSNSIVLQFTSSNRKPKCGCGRVPNGFLCLN